MECEQLIIEKTCEDKYANDCTLYNYRNADQHELVVTITLAEYRDLLRAKFDGEARKEKLNWFEQYNRANEAEKRVKELEAQIAAIKNIMPCTNKNDTEDEE